jgi:hypothetical protein
MMTDPDRAGLDPLELVGQPAREATARDLEQRLVVSCSDRRLTVDRRGFGEAGMSHG